MNNHQRDIIIAAGCGDLLRRDWAVRVLDALRCDTQPHDYGNGCFEVWWEGRGYTGPDPAAARLAAADAVWHELPESVRAEIGERP